MKFERYPKNPIIKRTEGTFYSIHVANPDVLLFNNEYHFYFRGQNNGQHDQIGVGYSSPSDFDGIHWEIGVKNPIIQVGRNAKDFDSLHILDPAAIVVNNMVYLYYTALSLDLARPATVGLAISNDGTHFLKYPANPVVIGTCPEIIFENDLFYLFYQRPNIKGQLAIYLCISEDGVHFPLHAERQVFGSSEQLEAFDCFSISTFRIWKEKKWFYVAYGGCNRYIDYPCAIGLARSQSLYEWERYPENPILERGRPGTWDEGALWFGTVSKINNTYYMWYEGGGTGMGLGSTKAKEASKKAREEDYGGYRKTSFSQMGLAVYPGQIPDW